MKKITKENRFEEAINSLVKGYFNNTLIATDCAACAVGNIVANAVGCDVFLDKEEEIGFWKNRDTSERVSHNWPPVVWDDLEYAKPERIKSSRAEIKATGYNKDELAIIEYAFLDHYSYEEGDNGVYNGLMSVVDVLCDIEGKTKEESEHYKKLFVS